jgi:hypothetical protein
MNADLVSEDVGQVHASDGNAATISTCPNVYLQARAM